MYGKKEGHREDSTAKAHYGLVPSIDRKTLQYIRNIHASHDAIVSAD